MLKDLSNWGNYPKHKAEEFKFNFLEELPSIIQNNKDIIARGNGRCYGDASLSSSVISTLAYKNIIAFDKEAGIITCEAGLTLDKLLEFILPKGWFLPVTPGTKYITVGGALASDVHGKNHHGEGTFADHVLSFTLVNHTGEELRVNDNENPQLFRATAGGMGLTGVITTVTFDLKKVETNLIKQKKIKARNLDEAMALFEEYSHHTYSMAWIDCLRTNKSLGRSLLMLGEHATLDEISAEQSKSCLEVKQKQLLNIPIYFPSIVLNTWSIKAFNFLYYNKEFKKYKEEFVGYDSFFYPLDAITNWNKMYGKPGFVQYQFVLPLESSKEGLKKILQKIAEKGMGSFLAVLKLFGEENSNYISFPMKGYTLALDFPVTAKLFPFLDELDKMVLDYGGRIYLSKDARMKASIYDATYPRLNEFWQVIKTYNPGKFSSLQSNRLYNN